MDGEELGLIGEDEGTEIGGEEGGDDGAAEEEIGEEPEGEGGEGGEEEEPEPGGREHGRTLPTEIRKALREFSSGNPEFAKRFPQLERQVTAALFKAGQADKLGGLQQLRAARELLESHGGAESIERMAEEVESGRLLQQGMSEGDPVLVDIWSKQHPEGFKNMVGTAIEKLESLDLPAHDRALSGPMYKTLDRCGVIGSMNDLETAIAGERFEDIQRHFSAIKNFLQELRNFANKAKAPDPLKADRERLAAERNEVQSERQKTFFGGVRTEVGTQTTSWINRALRQELAGRVLKVGTANRLRKQINEDLSAAVNTAPGYAEKYKAIMASGDHQRAVQFIVQNARAKIPTIVKRVLKDFNLGASSGVRRTPVRRSAGGGERGGTSHVITGRPKTSEIDFRRTDKATYLASIGGHGQAWRLDGKLAKW